MLHRFHDRFGTAGMVIAVIALVAALGGTALAAGALSSKQKKEVTKIAKKYAGKPGAAGPAGSAGPVGPAGPKGDQGIQGIQGIQGGVGPAGPEGTTGFTETLPSEKTETGDWSLSENSSGFKTVTSSVSFVIPLEAAPVVSYIPPCTEVAESCVTFPTPPAGCTGNVTEPGAEPGHLCVFARQVVNFYANPGELVTPTVCAFASKTINSCLLSSEAPTADPTGFGLLGLSEAGGLSTAEGTWAVTAE